MRQGLSQAHPGPPKLNMMPAGQQLKKRFLQKCKENFSEKKRGNKKNTPNLTAKFESEFGSFAAEIHTARIRSLQKRKRPPDKRTGSTYPRDNHNPNAEVQKSTPNHEISKTNTHSRELFRKVCANFCLLPCDTSQEPNGNCSENLFRCTFFLNYFG